MKKVKVGIVGLGELGTLHAHNLRFKIPGCELIALCGSGARKERLLKIQKEWEVPHCFFDMDEMLALAEIDAVVIASSTAMHYAHALAAIQAGKHVFIEKPIGMNIEECISIEQAAEKSDKIFAVGYMRRYDPSYMEAKKRIDAGEIGAPVLFRAYSADPIWVAEYLAKRAEKNGGCFIDLTVHDCDLARWFLGSEAESVYACGGAYAYPVFGERGDVDNGYALMRFKNGACAFFHSSRTAPHGTHVETEIVGTKGILRIGDEPRKDRVKAFTKEGIVQGCIGSYLERWEEAYYLEMQHFIDAAAQGKAMQPTAHDGTMATRMGVIMQNAYRSGALEKL